MNVDAETDLLVGGDEGRMCRVCGCTEDNACVLVAGKRIGLASEVLAERPLEPGQLDVLEVCGWSDVDSALCTACEPAIVDQYGRPART